MLLFQEIEMIHCTDLMKSTEVPWRSYWGLIIKPEDLVTVPVKHKDKTTDLNFHEVKMDVKQITGVNSCKGLWLVSKVYLRENSDIPSDIQKEYNKVFQGLGCMPWKYIIKVDPDDTPVIHAPRKIPLSL